MRRTSKKRLNLVPPQMVEQSGALFGRVCSELGITAEKRKAREAVAIAILHRIDHGDRNAEHIASFARDTARLFLK